jgi:hypothetical protein
MAQDLKGLIRSLNSRDNEERAEASKSISFFAKKGTSDVASIKPLISLLFDSNRFVRHNAAFAIGDLAEFCGIFDSSAVIPLQRLLFDIDDVVRWSAAFALRTYAKKSGYDMSFVQCFAGLLLDSNQRVRYNAAYAIGYLAEFGAFDKSTIYPLIGLLSDRNGIVRGSAAFALGCLAKKEVFNVAAIKPLMNLLSDYNGIVRKNAAEALNFINELTETEKIEEDKKPEVTGEVFKFHKWVHSPQSIAILIPKTEIKGLFNRYIIVQPNEVAVRVRDGKVEKVVDSGKVGFGGLFDPDNYFKDVDVVMMDTSPKDANWQVGELWTSDQHKIAAKGLIRYRTSDPKKFFLMVYAYGTYDKNRFRFLTLKDINERIKSEVLTRVLQPEVSDMRFDDIYGNRGLQHKIENEIELQLKQTLDMWGLELLRFTSEWNLGDKN